MEKNIEKTVSFGLIGKNIEYSFSRKYFTEKFEKQRLSHCKYSNFDLKDISNFKDINLENIKGFNVTIPYKESIIDYLDKLDANAAKIGAVNTIKVEDDYSLIGYNTDAYGFETSLIPLLEEYHTHALILGTGGASKAVAFVFNKLGISFKMVSRNPKNDSQIAYEEITKEVMDKHLIIVNCTPLGTYPDIKNRPNLPYSWITHKHLFYDLIYNPEKTTFLSLAKANGAVICNGLKMLELQAEKSWKIWNA